MDFEREEISLLESNIDHLTGEEIGQALEMMNAMPEVLDACWLPAIGKKNRPCGILQVMCKPADDGVVLQAIFRHTHTLGIRSRRSERFILPRELKAACVAGTEVPAKSYLLEGKEYMRIEADAVAAISRKKGVGAPAARFGMDKTIS